jgi:hypothetical protein
MVLAQVSVCLSAIMSSASFFRAFFLSRFSKPVCDRVIFRSIGRLKPQRIVEVGLDSGERAEDLVELAQRHRPTVEIRYTGIDMFDARVNENGISIKDAHKLLKPTGAKIQLIPGDPLANLARVANSLPSTDLLIISADHQSSITEPNWYYIPRMLHDHSLIFLQTETDAPYQVLTFSDVKRRAQTPAGDRSKAA